MHDNRGTFVFYIFHSFPQTSQSITSKQFHSQNSFQFFHCRFAITILELNKRKKLVFLEENQFTQMLFMPIASAPLQLTSRSSMNTQFSAFTPIVSRAICNLVKEMSIIQEHCLVEGCIRFAMANFAGFYDEVEVNSIRLHKSGFASLPIPKAIVRQNGQRVICSRSAQCLHCLRYEWILNCAHFLTKKHPLVLSPLSACSASGQTFQSRPCDSVNGKVSRNYGNH